MSTPNPTPSLVSELRICSGERAALEAASGDDVQCFICDKSFPGGEAIAIFGGRHNACPECVKRMDDERREEMAAVLRDITDPFKSYFQ